MFQYCRANVVWVNLKRRASSFNLKLNPRAVSIMARHTTHKQNNNHKYSTSNYKNMTNNSDNDKQTQRTAQPQTHIHNRKTHWQNKTQGGLPCRRAITRTPATSNQPTSRNKPWNASANQLAANLMQPTTYHTNIHLPTHTLQTLLLCETGSLAAAIGPPTMCARWLQ